MSTLYWYISILLDCIASLTRGGLSAQEAHTSSGNMRMAQTAHRPYLHILTPLAEVVLGPPKISFRFADVILDPTTLIPLHSTAYNESGGLTIRC